MASEVETSESENLDLPGIFGTPKCAKPEKFFTPLPAKYFNLFDISPDSESDDNSDDNGRKRVEGFLTPVTYRKRISAALFDFSTTDSEDDLEQQGELLRSQLNFSSCGE